MIKSIIHIADIHIRTYRYHDEYNEVFENLYAAGVIDPTKVARIALENAASVAGTVLLTECTLTQDKKSQNERMRQAQEGPGAF